MYVHGSVYVYLAIRVKTFGYINVFLWQKTDYVWDFFCLSLFPRESDIFRWEMIQGFYLGELLRKAKTLKSGRPLAQMVSLSTWETWRPAEKRPRHIIFTHNHLLISISPSVSFLTRSPSRDPHRTDLIAHACSRFHNTSPGGAELCKPPLAV